MVTMDDKTKDLQNMNIYQDEGMTLKTKSISLNIVTVDDLLLANDLLKECTSLEKTVEAERKKITDPLNTIISQFIEKAKAIIAPASEAKALVKEKILAYNREQDRIKQEELAKIAKQEEEARLAREAEENARKAEEERIRKEEEEKLKNASEEEAKKIEDDRIAREFEAEKQAKIAEQKKLEEKQNAELQRSAVEANAGVKPKGLRKVTKFEIVDATKVPRAFCSPDEAKIRESVKNGVTVIEGVRIWVEDAVQ